MDLSLVIEKVFFIKKIYACNRDNCTEKNYITLYVNIY